MHMKSFLSSVLRISKYSPAWCTSAPRGVGVGGQASYTFLFAYYMYMQKDGEGPSSM